MEATTQSAEPQSSPRESSLWPKRLLGPAPGLKEMNLACWGLFIAFLVIPICVIFAIQVRRGTDSIRQLHSDFVYFYGDGTIAREYPSARLYDFSLQQRVFDSICPPHEGVYGPSPYPPFVALFFAPFTRMSFERAYLFWFAISLALYVTGIVSTCRAVFPAERPKIFLALCLALAFSPFLFSTLINGQLAAVAVCAIGLALYQERCGNPFRSGLALALLVYKPTLLVIILPMLVLTRRFRQLAGFLSGMGVLVLASTAIDGPAIWIAFIRMSRSFGKLAGVGGKSRVVLWSHVDLISFFAAIPHRFSFEGHIILSLLVAAAGVALIVLLWQSARGHRPIQWLAWAATLTLTMLLNIYVPIYDSVLVVIAVVLTLGALRDLEWSRAARWIVLLALVIFAVSWKTEAFARTHHIQLLTLALMVLGVAQLVFLRRAIRQELPA